MRGSLAEGMRRTGDTLAWFGNVRIKSIIPQDDMRGNFKTRQVFKSKRCHFRNSKLLYLPNTWHGKQMIQPLFCNKQNKKDVWFTWALDNTAVVFLSFILAKRQIYWLSIEGIVKLFNFSRHKSISIRG